MYLTLVVGPPSNRPGSGSYRCGVLSYLAAKKCDARHGILLHEGASSELQLQVLLTRRCSDTNSILTAEPGNFIFYSAARVAVPP